MGRGEQNDAYKHPATLKEAYKLGYYYDESVENLLNLIEKEPEGIRNKIVSGNIKRICKRYHGQEALRSLNKIRKRGYKVPKSAVKGAKEKWSDGLLNLWEGRKKEWRSPNIGAEKTYYKIISELKKVARFKNTKEFEPIVKNLKKYFPLGFPEKEFIDSEYSDEAGTIEFIYSPIDFKYEEVLPRIEWYYRNSMIEEARQEAENIIYRYIRKYISKMEFDPFSLEFKDEGKIKEFEKARKLFKKINMGRHFDVELRGEEKLYQLAVLDLKENKTKYAELFLNELKKRKNPDMLELDRMLTISWLTDNQDDALYACSNLDFALERKLGHMMQNEEKGRCLKNLAMWYARLGEHSEVKNTVSKTLKHGIKKLTVFDVFSEKERVKDVYGIDEIIVEKSPVLVFTKAYNVNLFRDVAQVYKEAGFIEDEAKMAICVLNEHSKFGDGYPGRKGSKSSEQDELGEILTKLNDDDSGPKTDSDFRWAEKTLAKVGKDARAEYNRILEGKRRLHLKYNNQRAEWERKIDRLINEESSDIREGLHKLRSNDLGFCEVNVDILLRGRKYNAALKLVNYGIEYARVKRRDTRRLIELKHAAEKAKEISKLRRKLSK